METQNDPLLSKEINKMGECDSTVSYKHQKAFFRSENNLTIKKQQLELPTKYLKSENDLLTMIIEPKTFAIELKNSDKRSKSICQRLAIELNLELLNDHRFLLLVIGMSFSYVAELNFNLMIPFVLMELIGMGKEQVAYTMSIQSATDICARFLIPFLATKYQWHATVLYMVALIGLILSRTVLIIFKNNWNIIYTLMIFLGVSKGIKAVFQALIIPNYVSLDKLPAANGLVFLANGILSLLLGPIFGIIHDQTNSYVIPLFVTSAISVICIILWIIEYFIHKTETI